MWVFGGTLIPEQQEHAGVRDIAASDPRFDLRRFLDLVVRTHREVHQAVARRDAPRLAAVVSPPLIDDLLRRDRRSWEHEVDRVVHLATIDAAAGDRDTITVRVGAVIGGRDSVEDWTLERVALAHPQLNGVLVESCHRCGAGLNVDADGNCTYCGTHLIGVAGPWFVASVDDTPRVLDPPTVSTDLSALDPNFPVEDFLAFVRTVYLNVHRATAGGALGSIRDVLTTEMRAYLSSAPEELAWDLPVDTVTHLRVVDVQRAALDRIVVQLVGRTGDIDVFEEWTFERPAGWAGETRTTCSFCGAPIALDEDGNCRYCGTHLMGVQGDWRLASARVPPAEMVSHPVVVKAMQHRAGRVALAVFLLIAIVGTIAAIIAIVVASA